MPDKETRSVAGPVGTVDCGFSRSFTKKHLQPAVHAGVLPCAIVDDSANCHDN